MSHHATAGRLGGLASWARTPDRTARTTPARTAGPGSLDYWLARLDPCMDQADQDTRLRAADALRKAHFTRLAMKSAAARRSQRGAA